MAGTTHTCSSRAPIFPSQPLISYPRLQQRPLAPQNAQNPVIPLHGIQQGFCKLALSTCRLFSGSLTFLTIVSRVAMPTPAVVAAAPDFATAFTTWPVVVEKMPRSQLTTAVNIEEMLLVDRLISWSGSVALFFGDRSTRGLKPRAPIVYPYPRSLSSEDRVGTALRFTRDLVWFPVSGIWSGWGVVEIASTRCFLSKASPPMAAIVDAAPVATVSAACPAPVAAIAAPALRTDAAPAATAVLAVAAVAAAEDNAAPVEAAAAVIAVVADAIHNWTADIAPAMRVAIVKTARLCTECDTSLGSNGRSRVGWY